MKLPESLWQTAVELARQHGVYPVAHPLPLEYTQTEETPRAGPTSPRKATKPAFMELVAPPRAQLNECVIESESLSGSMNAGAKRDHGAPCERRFVAVQK
jgi:hypothetical protein